MYITYRNLRFSGIDKTVQAGRIDMYYETGRIVWVVRIDYENEYV